MSGLPDNAVKESTHRVESSMKTAGYFMPRNKVVVNLAPANIRKEGSAYDLPLALCILEASGQIMSNGLSKYVIMGELALDGTLRPIKGVLPIAIQARKEQFKGFILPKSNAREAAIVNNLDILGVETLREAIDFFEGARQLEPLHIDARELFMEKLNHYDSDFKDVQGQEKLRSELVSLWSAHDKAVDDTTKVDAEYLEVIATRDSSAAVPQTPTTPLSRRAESLADRIEEGAAGLAAFAEGLSEAEWHTPVSVSDGRSVGVIVHHVATVYPIEIDLARTIASGKAVTEVTWEVVAELNAKHAQDQAEVAKAATLELLRRNSHEAAAAVRAFTDDELDRAAPFSLSYGAPVTAQFVVEDHALRHSWHHLARIRKALGR